MYGNITGRQHGGHQAQQARGCIVVDSGFVDRLPVECWYITLFQPRMHPDTFSPGVNPGLNTMLPYPNTHCASSGPGAFATTAS